MGLEVLVVDDSLATRLVIERVLRENAPEVGKCHHASNGREALELLKTQWIDIAFVDLHMPEMDGREFIRTVRQSELWRTLPVAAISSESSDETAEELAELGATCYERKPLTPDLIRAALGTLKEAMQ